MINPLQTIWLLKEWPKQTYRVSSRGAPVLSVNGAINKFKSSFVENLRNKKK